MKSPFPGMDPYIEASGQWADFHAKLIGDIERALAEALPPRYDTRLGERSYIVLVGADGKVSRPFFPDVGVSMSRNEPDASAGRTSTLSLPARGAPVAVRPFLEEQFRERFIEIYEAEPERRLVTCIELLSPSNKQKGSKGWKKYLRKRQALMLGDANLVEIDLLRRGTRMPMFDPWPNSPYTLLVARQDWIPNCLVWPAHFREPLPPIPIPLAKPDPDMPLDLQPLIETVYRRARYGRSIDYSQELKPTLEAADAGWLAEQLRARQANP